MIGFQTWAFPRNLLDPVEVRKQLKQRSAKQIDPFAERGVVLPPVWRDRDQEVFQRRPGDFVLLRQSLLYWDQVTWPQLVTLDFSGGFDQAMKRYKMAGEVTEPDLQYLKDEGLLDTTPGTISMVGPGQNVWNERNIWPVFESTYLNLELHEPGQWAMAKATDHFVSPDATVPVAEGALGSLANLLPHPAPTVIYRQIVEFRRKNRDSLMTLRAAFDEFHLEIIRNADSAHVYGATHRRLDAAISDVWKLTAQERFDVEQGTLKMAIAFAKGAVTSALAAIATAPYLPFPLSEAAIAFAMGGGSLAALCHITTDKVANPTDQPGIAAYLIKARDDEIIAAPTK